MATTEPLPKKEKQRTAIQLERQREFYKQLRKNRNVTLPKPVRAHEAHPVALPCQDAAKMPGPGQYAGWESYNSPLALIVSSPERNRRLQQAFHDSHHSAARPRSSLSRSHTTELIRQVVPISDANRGAASPGPKYSPQDHNLQLVLSGKWPQNDRFRYKRKFLPPASANEVAERPVQSFSQPKYLPEVSPSPCDYDPWKADKRTRPSPKGVICFAPDKHVSRKSLLPERPEALGQGKLWKEKLKAEEDERLRSEHDIVNVPTAVAKIVSAKAVICSFGGRPKTTVDVTPGPAEYLVTPGALNATRQRAIPLASPALRPPSRRQAALSERPLFAKSDNDVAPGQYDPRIAVSSLTLRSPSPILYVTG